jgi:CheY-like chemotaxis protein
MWSLAEQGPSDSPGPPVPPKPSRKLDEHERRQKTILVVEDDPDVRSTVLEVLAEESFGAVAVRNGVEAIRYLHYAPRLPDLILLDLMMPVMDGWELKKRLDREPKWKDIPVVIYSANTRVRPISATVVLAKPISLTQLIDTIAMHVKKEGE